MSFHVVPKALSRAPSPRPEDIAADAARRAEIDAAVAEKVARLRAAAEQEGRKEGELAARAALEAQEAALGAAAAALRDAVRQLALPLTGKEAEAAELVLDMALELARHVVGMELSANPAPLKALLEKLLHEAAAERGPRQNVVVRVNPADHAQIDAGLLGGEVHLLADAAITAGGAKVELVAPDGDMLEKTEWDATVEARLAALREAIRRE